MCLKLFFLVIVLSIVFPCHGEGSVNIRKAVIENHMLTDFLKNKLIPFIKNKGYNENMDGLYIICREPLQGKDQPIDIKLFQDDSFLFMKDKEEISRCLCTVICDLPIIIVCKVKPDFIKISKGYVPVHWHEPTFIELFDLDEVEATWHFNYKDKELTFTGFDSFYIDWFKESPLEEYTPEKPWRLLSLERNIPTSISFEDPDIQIETLSPESVVLLHPYKK